MDEGSFADNYPPRRTIGTVNLSPASPNLGRHRPIHQPLRPITRLTSSLINKINDYPFHSKDFRAIIAAESTLQGLFSSVAELSRVRLYEIYALF